MGNVFNILIISHGTIAQSYVQTLSMIAGELSTGVEACSIMEGESRDELIRRVGGSMGRLQCPGGVLVFADMFGGTPCNVTVEELLDHGSKVHLLTGINLPMLLAAAGNRENDLEQAAREAWEAGLAGIVDVNSRIAAAAEGVDNE